MDSLFPFHNNYYSLVMLSDVFTVYKCTAELFCWHLFHFDRCWTLIGAEMPYSSSAQLISVHHQQSRLLCKSEAYSHSDLLARITFRPKHQTFFAIPRRSISVCRLWHGDLAYVINTSSWMRTGLKNVLRMSVTSLVYQALPHVEPHGGCTFVTWKWPDKLTKEKSCEYVKES